MNGASSTGQMLDYGAPRRRKGSLAKRWLLIAGCITATFGACSAINAGARSIGLNLFSWAWATKDELRAVEAKVDQVPSKVIELLRAERAIAKEHGE